MEIRLHCLQTSNLRNDQILSHQENRLCKTENFQEYKAYVFAKKMYNDMETMYINQEQYL